MVKTPCSILELCVFLYHVVNLKNTRCIEIDAHGPVPICSVLIYNPYRRYEVWRLMTYLAVHGGYIHIASNIIGKKMCKSNFDLTKL